MTKITKSQRDHILSYIDRYTDYDFLTVQIAANGDVTALKDADKTHNAPETVRYLVGDASDLAAR